jgi:glutaredoxin
MRILMVLCLLATVANAEIYRWTDAHGRTHYSDKAPADRKVQQVKIRVQSISGPAIVTQAPASNSGTGTRSAAAREPVKLFTTAWCGYCKKAKAHLAARGVPYQEIDVEGTDSARREFSALGGRGVPVILVGGQRMDGFDAAALDAMLAAGGY